MQAHAEARETEARGRAELEAAVAGYEEQLDAAQRAADERQSAAESAARAAEQWQRRCVRRRHVVAARFANLQPMRPLRLVTLVYNFCPCSTVVGGCLSAEGCCQGS